MKSLTPNYIKNLSENIERMSNEDKKRLSRQRRIEIIGYCNLKKRQLYNTLIRISNDLAEQIDSYTYWNSSSNERILVGSNNLSNRIENRVLSKGKNNPYYSHIEAIIEIAEEEGYELSTIKNYLSKSILQKIESIGYSRKALKGRFATLPF